MIRHSQEDEPASQGRSLDPEEGINLWRRETEAAKDSGRVVGGSRFGKGCEVNAGDLPEQDSRKGKPAGVRAAVVAQASRGQNQDGTTVTHGPKPSNDRWSQGRQEGKRFEQQIERRNTSESSNGG